MSKELQIRNSTVDFLVFTRDAGEDGIEVRVQNGDVWLAQKAISQLFDVDRSVVTKHLSNIFKEGELDENSVCAKFAQTADDGKTYNYKFYSLAAIIAVGYRINSERATQFRTWATKVLDTFTKQGYVLDKSRLINGQIFDEDYFEHEIQSSSGGIQLDTMFVDEGFGSLDEDALDQAIRALKDLSQGSRLVGIVSHVAELKERIDKKIIVTKKRTEDGVGSAICIEG